ncbi:MAG: FAD-dependent oxidoreductase, partial [Patescibacteria group bacterium]
MIKEIIIVGGGFGGVRVAKKLAKSNNDIHITLIDKSHYHTFYSDLYEVATANLAETVAHVPNEFYELKSTSAYPLENIFSNNLNVTVLYDEVVGINFQKNEVLLKSEVTKRYDYLVLGAGSETNYYNISGLYECVFPLKSLWDAMSIRNAIDEVFFNAAKKSTITIVIGGGGFTGCEFAGELCYFVRQLAKQHGHSLDAIGVVMIEGSTSLLSGLDAWVQKKTRKRLESIGLKVMVNSIIKSIEDQTIILDDESKIPFDILIWTAGVRANKLTSGISGPKLEKVSCVVVDKSLR